MRFSFVEAAHEALLDDLLNTRIDLAITYHYELDSVRTAAGVTAQPPRSDPPYVLTPVDGALSRKDRVNLADRTPVRRMQAFIDLCREVVA